MNARLAQRLIALSAVALLAVVLAVALAAMRGEPPSAAPLTPATQE